MALFETGQGDGGVERPCSDTLWGDAGQVAVGGKDLRGKRQERAQIFTLGAHVPHGGLIATS